MDKQRRYVLKILFDGQAVISRLEPVNLDDFPNLKVIGSPTTGLEHLPLDECAKRGIKIFSLQDSVFFTKFITSTAEHTIGLMISLMRNYKTALNGPYQDRVAYKGHKIADKTLGIIGYGRVGKQVGQIALGLGMKVLSYDKVLNYSNESDLNGLLYESDVVSLHINLPGNEGFFTRQMIEMMKPEAYLVNTSRDGIIEKGALVEALKSGIIKGASVDFLDSPDLVEYAKTHDNLILTNHLGGCTFEDTQLTEEFIIKQVENYLKENKYVT